MSISQLFDVDAQLTFYGAYHSNRINVLIHIICVPILVWTFQVLAAPVPAPSFIPSISYKLNDYLIFETNFSVIQATIYMFYYLVLEPTAALLYLPQMTLSLLTATAFSKHAGHITQAALLHVASWIAQFLGHGLAEKRAPALLDNLIGALVLAPFFVHLEILFKLGYKPEMHKRINNEIGKEILRIRKLQANKNRASAKGQ
ncbi:hypothetical protein AMATHDRAFT_74097 [Amanita thiersii Skay4041]|uniref:DUF962-domain-containing protein n=1 Tax=Amanita thiersii Skay4041 TaxID=703135 RepID=A0A2A9NTF2_9AGAR|nr:hypothetical protein AMATHDRAFT_74097 [Amanita thiersii Skay4041]